MIHTDNHARKTEPLREPTHKTCSRCQQSKPLVEFGRNARSKDDHQAWCKPCLSTYNAARYVPHSRPKISPEEKRARKASYRAANPEQRIEERRRYYQNNREKVLERQRRYRQARAALKPKKEPKVKELKQLKPKPEPKPALILDPALQKAINSFMSSKGLKSKRTQNWYEISIRLYCEHLVEADLEQWPETPEKWADNINSFTGACSRRGLKESSISDYLRALTSWIRRLQARKLIKPGALDLIEWPARYRPLPKAARPEDVAKMMSLLEQSAGESWKNLRDYALLTLALDTGARIGEIAALTLPKLDMERRHFTCTQTKTNRDRVVVFSPAAAQVLQAWLDKRAELDLPADLLHVFVSEPKGLPWQSLTDSGMRQVLKRWQNRSEITRFNFHSLRHSYAVYSLRAGSDLIDVQKQLGHTSITTTSRYLMCDDAGRASRHDVANPLAYLLKQAQEAARQEAA